MFLNEEQLRSFSRLSKTQEGVDFKEILVTKLLENHDQLLDAGPEFRAELVGYGNCLRDILKNFKECDDKLRKNSVVTGQDRF